jgi:predicted transcriptional regulator
MSTPTVRLPDALKKTIDELAASEGCSVSQFLAGTAGEQLVVVMTMDYPRRGSAAGCREDFDNYLNAVPNATSAPGDEL